MSELTIQNAIGTLDVMAADSASVESPPAMFSLENPSVNLDDPAVYDLLVEGRPAASGVRVTEKSSLSHPAVWQALNMISGDLAAIPLEPKQKLPDGDRVTLTESDPLYSLVHWEANSEQTAFEFWQQMMFNRLLWNNAYAYIIRNRDGTPRELIPLLPDRTSPERLDGVKIYLTEVETEMVPLPASEVFHIRGVSLDNLAGHKWVMAARDAVGLGLAELKFASEFYKNGGRVGGILELPAGMSKKAKDTVESGFRKTYGSSEAFKTVVLRESAKFHAAQTTPEAAQVVEGRQESVRDIARYFNVRPGKLGDETKESFSSKAEDNRDHWDTTLKPHARSITQEARRKLTTPSQKRQGYFFAHDTRALLTMSFDALASSLQTLRAGEIINADEARDMIGMNKRADGKGGDYVNPNINTRDNTELSSSEVDPAAESAFQQLAGAAIDRIAMKVTKLAEAKTRPKFCEWMDRGGVEEFTPAFTEAIGEVMTAAAPVLSISDADERVTVVVQSIVSDTKQLMDTVRTSTPARDVKSVLSANLRDWSQGIGERYTAQLFGEFNE